MRAENGKKEKKTSRPNWFGRLLTHLPSSCILLYPIYLAAKLHLSEKTLYYAALPDAFDGLRVAFVTDIHYGDYFKKERLDALIEKVNALGADIVLLGGDYAEDSETAVRFFQMRPQFRANMLVAGVAGNHDRTPPESNIPLFDREMQACHIESLNNKTIYLEKNSEKIAICGVDDYYHGYPDIEKVKKQCQGAAFVVFVSHTPDILPESYADKPWFQLALCGHTHGGQVAIFGHALHSSSQYGQKYQSGWKKEKGADVLISCGVGTSWFPVRLGTEAEYHLLTIKKGAVSI